MILVLVKEFTGQCMAIFHWIDNNDDEFIVVPDGFNYFDKQIIALT